MPEQVTQHQVGRIRKTVPSGFFGFIQIDGKNDDIFFHKNNMSAWKKSGHTPAVGTMVRFRLVPTTAQGMNDRAIDVEVL